MSDSNKGAVVVAAFAAFLVMVVLALFQSHSDPEVDALRYELKFPESPPVERVYTPSECVVEVSNYMSDGRRSHGRGVIVKDHGKTFVLTSSMIFTHEGEIAVDYVNVRYTAEIINQNDVWGLVALECSFMEGTRYTKINEFPNHPPDTQVLVGNWGEVNVLEYANDDWVILDGNLPAGATGMPTENAGGLVGIIVGLNRANVKQAIMVGNRAIREFTKQVTHMETPDVFPRNPNDLSTPFEDRRRMPLRPPANPNILFGNE